MSFFDMFGPMFDPEGGSNRAGRQNPRKPSNDDPIILNVETDGGDGPQPSSNVPPKRPSGPRITSKPNRPRKPSNGSKIFIGVVLALAIVIGLFFALAQFVTDVMWYSQLGFQSVIWTQLGTRVGLWLAYAVLIAAVGFISATLATSWHSTGFTPQTNASRLAVPRKGVMPTMGARGRSRAMRRADEPELV